MTSLGASCFSCSSSFIFPVVSFSLGDTLGVLGWAADVACFFLVHPVLQAEALPNPGFSGSFGSQFLFYLLFSVPARGPSSFRPFCCYYFLSIRASKCGHVKERRAQVSSKAQAKPAAEWRLTHNPLTPACRDASQAREKENGQAGRQASMRARPWSVRSACQGTLCSAAGQCRSLMSREREALVQQQTGVWPKQREGESNSTRAARLASTSKQQVTCAGISTGRWYLRQAPDSRFWLFRATRVSGQCLKMYATQHISPICGIMLSCRFFKQINIPASALLARDHLKYRSLSSPSPPKSIDQREPRCLPADSIWRPDPRHGLREDMAYTGL